ncbi:DUF3611 family protein [Leptolyngbya iicbica]|uniref:DUF3611 family protein n=2 Tax=Cyanophyceae TaxID=3028117 RepID=A0A4Q7E8R5_9CYAN|nr:DUF3611 family protein [Leptolyngbya sp. LK]RZM78873.1 DUF3611 family protein [Leptolyngbya sp. LK]
MDSPPHLPGPSLPPTRAHDLPPAAERVAKAISRVGRASFWGHLVAAAVMVALLGLAIISRSIDDGDRTLWVGLSLVTAIASFITVLLAIWLAFQLIRSAKRLALPYMEPTPRPDDISQRVALTFQVSFIGLGIGLFGTELSAVSLLAKTLTHPQGAALYSPDSTLRVLDVMVILINGGLALTHFCGLAAYGWLQQKVLVKSS